VRFRRLLVVQGLDRSLFEAIAGDPDSKGANVRKGTLIDATVIGASKGDKEAAWVRHRTRPPAHGYKAHIAADKDSGIIRAVETTPSNEPDVSIAPAIIPDAPGEAYADRAYDALSVEKAIEAAGGTSKLLRKGHRHLPAEGWRRITARCAPSAAGSRKSSEPGNAATASDPCDGLAFPRQNGPSRGHRLQRQTILAHANRLSGPAKRACNADLQNRPSAKPVRKTPSPRSTGDLPSATILKCLPDHTRRCKPSAQQNATPRAPVSKHFGTMAPGSGLRPHSPDGQRDHFRRAQEANRRVGCAKAGGNDEMTVSLDDMTVDKITLVAAHRILGEYGKVDLAAVRVAAERERNALWNTPENGGLMGQQDDGPRISNLRHGPGKIVAPRKKPWGLRFGDLIAKARDPEGLAVFRYAQRMVFENVDAGRTQGAAHAFGAVGGHPW
jgi:DDE family transposase